MTGPPAKPPQNDALRENLIGLLSQVADVYEIRLLESEEREHVRQLETLAEETGAAGGMMPFVNEGIWAALDSELVYAVTTGPMRGEMPAPWTIMLDDEDKLIGEWLPQSRIEEVRNNRRCFFLSDDFVMYKDRKPVGRSRFVMPFICLPLDEDSPFSVCGIGSPSTPADAYLRELMGGPGPDVATLLLGVNLRGESGREEPPADPGRDTSDDRTQEAT